MTKRRRPPVMVPGFLAAGISAGIKKREKKDLALIVSRPPATAAGVFTTNRVKAAPVLLDMERIGKGPCRAVVVNSGCANACTGPHGLKDAREVARIAASGLGVPEESVLVASTGVIGSPLPVGKIARGIRRLIPLLTPEGIEDAAEAMMTTDTFPKVVVKKAQAFSIAGIAKGAGMIHPRMATMLSFILTDVALGRKTLDRVLRRAVEGSFHRITVDGETSTNDTVIMLASGLRRLTVRDMSVFRDAVDEVARALAGMIVGDGEGATKRIEILVRGARTPADAGRVAERIALSPLVKTAFFGEDPNWGRIMAAIGSSGIDVDPESVDVFYGRIPVVRSGRGCGRENEARARGVLTSDSPKVVVDLHAGKARTCLLTCDLSEEYVRINSAYRT